MNERNVIRHTQARRSLRTSSTSSLVSIWRTIVSDGLNNIEKQTDDDARGGTVCPMPLGIALVDQEVQGRALFGDHGEVHETERRRHDCAAEMMVVCERAGKCIDERNTRFIPWISDMCCGTFRLYSHDELERVREEEKTYTESAGQRDMDNRGH